MADLTGWDTRRYLQLLRRQAERLRADPAVQRLRFKPEDLATETLARATDPETPACPATTERDRLAWLLRIERDVLYGWSDKQGATTETWAGKVREDGLRSVGQALLNSTVVWDETLKESVAADDEDMPRPFGKYVDFKLVSQGGMGAVYRCRDQELGRVVAMKVMHAQLAARPDRVRDFQEEAQVAGQLQHPNVAPVHERGVTPDGRPYFTMRLIQGRTLMEAITEHHARPTAKGLDALLHQFHAICETVGFAHKKDVLHRDLKPLNVMVGPFGEVQVLDWGLSKVLAGGPDHSTSIRTVGSGDPEAVTQAGTVRGTFAYMSPEQADPTRAPTDKHSDVFSLGAILCEILSGRPPYTSNEIDRRSRQEDLWRQARGSETAAAFKRLDTAGAAPELVGLARRCLAENPHERPSNAGVLADIVEKYFARQEADERSGQIQEATQGERQKRRVWQAALAISLAVAGLLGVGGYFWYAQQHKTRLEVTSQEVTAALKKSAELQGQAAGMPSETTPQAEAALAVWQQALQSAEQAESLLKPEATGEYRAEVAAAVDAARNRVAEAKDRVALARRNDKLMGELPAAERLAAIRLVGFRPDFEASRLAFEKAFHEYGVEIGAADSGPAVEKLKQVPANRQGELIRGLDYWALIDSASRTRLRAIADRLDGDKWRGDFRRALDRKEGDALVALSKEPAAAVASGEADLLGDALRDLGRVPESVHHLQAAERSRPGDYWVQISLGISLIEDKPAQYAAAAECFKTARGVEPRSAAAASNHALALMRTGEADRAVKIMEDAVNLQPDSAPLRCNLAAAIMSKSPGDSEAERQANEAHKLDPKYEEATAVLALCRLVRGDKKNATELLDSLSTGYQESPTPLLCRMILSAATIPPKERDASKYAHKLAAAAPRTEVGLFALVLAELLDGDTLAAEKAAREMVVECPYGIWESLGQTLLAEVLMFQGRLTEAEQAVKVATSRRDLPLAHDALCKIRLRQGRFTEASDELKKLRELNKNVAVLATLYQLNQLVLDAALKIDAHADAVAAGKEQLKEPLRSMVAEAALLKERTRLARDLYKPLVDVSDKPGLEHLASHGLSVVSSYEGVSHRTNAARAGVKVGAGIGSDVAKVTDEERAKARKDAVALLRSDLDFKAKALNGPTEAILAKFAPNLLDQLVSKERYLRWLIFCLECDDFKSVRDVDTLAKLPAAERKEWERLWNDIRAAVDDQKSHPSPKRSDPAGE